MDSTIINNINELVKPDDVLYHLGDFSCKSGDHVASCRKRINCKNIHLIFGNHDKKNISKYFNSAQDYLKININGQKIILFHYALAIWECSHYGSWNLFAHSHGKHNAWKAEHMPFSLSLDVGVDCWDYKPLSLEFISEYMKKILEEKALAQQELKELLINK